MFAEFLRHANALGFPQGAFFFFFTSFLLLCVVLYRSGAAPWASAASLPLGPEDVDSDANSSTKGGAA
jgi:hypothetical protein